MRTGAPCCQAASALHAYIEATGPAELTRAAEVTFAFGEAPPPASAACCPRCGPLQRRVKWLGNYPSGPGPKLTLLLGSTYGTKVKKSLVPTLATFSVRSVLGPTSGL